MLAIFEYGCLVVIILGNYTKPQVAGRDQDKFDEWDKKSCNKDVIMIKCG